MQVISKLAPNEFLISMNSATVLIRFIVFCFTNSHIGGRGVKERHEIDKYLNQETETEEMMAHNGGCSLAFALNERL